MLVCTTSTPVVHLTSDPTHDRLVAVTAGGQLLVWDVRRVARWAIAPIADGPAAGSTRPLPVRVDSGATTHPAAPLRVSGVSPFLTASYFPHRSPGVTDALVTVEGDGGVTRVWDTTSNPWTELWCVPDSGCHSSASSVALAAATCPTPGTLGGPGVFATAGTDGVLNVFDLTARRHTLQLKLQSPPTALAFVPDGRFLLVGDAAGVTQALGGSSMQPAGAVVAPGGGAIRALAVA